MALFDTTGGLGGLLGDFSDYGFGVPRNTGLVADPDRDAINKRALLSGLISAGLTYAATPKNLGAGNVIPYLGKAGLAGFNTSQDVVDRALNTAYRNRILTGRDDNIRTIKQDRFEVTQEKQPDGSYKEIARSSLDAPKEGKTNIGNVNPADVTPASLAKFAETNNYGDLKFVKGAGGGLGLKDIYGEPQKDVSGNLVYIPKVPGYPIRDLTGNVITNVKLAEKGGEKLTEGERTAGFLSTRLSNSLKQLQAVTGQDPSAAAPNIGAEATKFFTRSDYFKNLVNPESRQQVEAAQYDILDSALTLGTGAAYTREQLESYRRSYFPQLGDKPKNIEDKAKRLQGVLDAAYTKAGRASTQEGGDKTLAKPKELSAQDKQALDWSNSNPTDPRSAQIKQRLGL